ncbi:hypothetical protein [Streptomyces gilvosporeus]|uniref:Protein phosphatase n=1 Tax=Streptomyces gilvosporeus TaxID=553510 RepID=A0A1V0TSU4_9ACTN|nr:hypothetical protein [Streptomyces gilvosporeus]ARF55963.1 hypothetical protein B1H19_18815 [Streptomyces gilvosporeus]
MSADHIDPSGIPTYTGNLEEVEARAKALKKEAGAIRDKGADVHSSFQGLRAYYSAPEAEQLFATTKPVATKANHFADELEKVGAALDTFAAEVRPLVARLHKLEGAAAHFVADIKDDEDWQYDPVKVAVNKQLIQEVSATVQAFWAAEVAAANKIVALVHGTPWSLGDGTKKGGHTYGLTKQAMSSAGDTPWGKVVDQKRHWYDPGAVVSWVKNFVWDGTVIDGMWGTLKGLGTLLNPWGDNFGAAWKSMGHLATVTTVPLLLPLVPLLPDGSVKSWMTDSMKTTVEVGKSMVAWDQWDKNSGRAAGASFFNIGTLLATRGGSGAVKTGAEAAGAGAKIANAAARVGRVTRYMDPTTHIVNAVGAAAKLTKLDAAIGNAFKAVKTSAALDHLRETFTVTGRTDASGAVHLPNGQPVHLDGPLPDLPPGKTAIHLPDGAGKVPPGSIMYDHNTFLTPDRKVVDAQGIPKTGSDATWEPSAAQRETLHNTPPEKATAPTDHELATVGAEQRHHAMANAGDGNSPRGDLGPQASHQSSEATGAEGKGSGLGQEWPTQRGGTGERHGAPSGTGHDQHTSGRDGAGGHDASAERPGGHAQTGHGPGGGGDEAAPSHDVPGHPHGAPDEPLTRDGETPTDTPADGSEQRTSIPERRRQAEDILGPTASRVVDLDRWLEFHSRKVNSQFEGQVLHEMREARRLLEEHPDHVLHTALEVDAPKRPNGEDMSEFDLGLAMPDGPIVHRVEVTTVAEPVEKFSDVTDGINHALKKVLDRAVEGAPIPRPRDASVYMKIATFRSKGKGQITERFPDGKTQYSRPDGTPIRTVDIFDKIIENLMQNKPEAAELDRITFIDPDNGVIAEIVPSATGWERVL